MKIGNSRGVRLPKPFIEEAGLRDNVELRVRGNTIVIAAARSTRAGWAEAAQDAATKGEGRIDAPTPTRFEREDWQW